MQSVGGLPAWHGTGATQSAVHLHGITRVEPGHRSSFTEHDEYESHGRQRHPALCCSANETTTPLIESSFHASAALSWPEFDCRLRLAHVVIRPPFKTRGLLRLPAPGVTLQFQGDQSQCGVARRDHSAADRFIMPTSGLGAHFSVFIKQRRAAK